MRQWGVAAHVAVACPCRSLLHVRRPHRYRYPQLPARCGRACDCRGPSEQLRLIRTCRKLPTTTRWGCYAWFGRTLAVVTDGKFLGTLRLRKATGAARPPFLRRRSRTAASGRSARSPIDPRSGLRRRRSRRGVIYALPSARICRTSRASSSSVVTWTLAPRYGLAAGDCSGWTLQTAPRRQLRQPRPQRRPRCRHANDTRRRAVTTIGLRGLSPAARGAPTS